MFLGITADVTNWTDPPAGSGGGASGTAFSLILIENPFAEFVELPPAYAGLHYSNILCGIVKGALEMVQLQVRQTDRQTDRQTQTRHRPDLPLSCV
jgi:trafficking protein particle complex subunit 3